MPYLKMAALFNYILKLDLKLLRESGILLENQNGSFVYVKPIINIKIITN
jgi:hypothetical protein